MITKPVQTLYVAGPMTGRPDMNHQAFRDAGAALVASGYTPMLPLFPIVEGRSWAAYMRDAFRMLIAAHGIATLPGWEGSRGASLEVYIANQVDMPVMPVMIWCAARPPSARPVVVGGRDPILFQSRAGVEVTAVQWMDDPLTVAAARRMGAPLKKQRTDSQVRWEVYDYLHDSWIGLNAGNWVVRGTMGEFYPVEHDVFWCRYEPVLTDPPTNPPADPGQSVGPG